MKREVTTRAVVVGRHAAGEGSVRILLYTEVLGLVSCIAKSAREERSKLRAHLLVGTRGTYSLVRGAYEWRVIGAVATSHTYFALHSEPARVSAASVIALVSRLVHGDGYEHALFDALWCFFDSLSHIPAEAVLNAEKLAVVRILFALGYVSSEGENKELLASSDYSPDALRHAAARAPRLVRVINEGLLASGLAH